MVFSSNTTNILFGAGVNSEKVIYQGSYGLIENAQSETSSTHGTVVRWSNVSKRWEPVATAIIDDSGNLDVTGDITSTGTVTGDKVIGAVYQ